MLDIDYKIVDWKDLQRDSDWPTLLVGNGASINLWQDFQYGKLLKKATLGVAAKEVFTELKSTNFEEAMEAVRYGRLVAQALRRDTTEFDRLYNEIRDGLFGAVNVAHMPYGQFLEDQRLRIADYVTTHRRVFTTNYDLTMYWSLMTDTKYRDLFTDLFGGPDVTFDPFKRLESIQHSTAVFYLHGAVHLWQDDATNTNGKWVRINDQNLLDLAVRYHPSESRRPLLVSEGNYEDKLSRIWQSPYLSFCIKALAQDSEDIVLFGHRLATGYDDHVASALANGEKKQIAISLRRGPDEQEHQLHYQERFLNTSHSLRFFDATTHPLGC